MNRPTTWDDPQGPCRYCEKAVEDDNYLECQQCRRMVHIKCLPHASTPGDLLGDVFFDFSCVRCVLDRAKESCAPKSLEPIKEELVRQKIPWLLVLTLTLHNLSVKQKGLGHHGFFHWRTHIISFVDKNWNFIFGPNVRRRKQWTGSVSGALSHNSPEYFQSGLEVFQEHGWWKLANPFQTPRSVLREYEKKQLQRQQLRIEKRLPIADETSCSSEISVTDHTSENTHLIKAEAEETNLTEGCARTIPYMGRQPKVPAPPLPVSQERLPTPPVAEENTIPPRQEKEEEPQNEPLSMVQASLMDFLAESLGGDDFSMFGSLPGIMPPPLIGEGKNDFFMTEPLLQVPSNSEGLYDMDTSFEIPSATEERKGAKNIKEETKTNSTEEISTESSEKQKEYEKEDEKAKEEEPSDYQPRIVQVTNYQAREASETIKEEPLEDEMHDEDEEIQEKIPFIEPCIPSGFLRQPRRNWPWLQEAQDSDDLAFPTENLQLMSVYEEQKLYQRLHKIFSLEQECQISIPAYVRRIYRKLSLRKWKRDHNRPIFNLDEHIDPVGRALLKMQGHQQAQILDRYQLLAHSRQDARSAFHARLAGCTQYELFESPYSQRVLHPFIFRSKTIAPPWLKLMCELQHRVNRSHPVKSTIDFCYVRPQHIPAVNALLQSSFWPNIDVSECLSYPDYSVVALYKKLVIGCGFLVPDVGYNEAYISFMAVRPCWQRSGIASVMLYHLIQTCISKDITLHVSATNSAVMLYQKFGFKMEEIILDFYDKYMPLDSKQSKNAFFLRLQR
ncbi:LOW QUALITY PROTEIN: cysteine-rich protein 2-binding protein [Drosophila eugracilis]|uniref:LOW QUALITY PROTEIN: cysteine-rich protein 2-binding protein n=1 Tax=Drosophila eugracilis TaxID=29029 RepID=UPI001BD99331|nr:LOW QUALITY PROTEIN: cysteine-rich protein 2-binding protein [Drosophila eugracilis]